MSIITFRMKWLKFVKSFWWVTENFDPNDKKTIADFTKKVEEPMVKEWKTLAKEEKEKLRRWMWTMYNKNIPTRRTDGT